MAAVGGGLECGPVDRIERDDQRQPRRAERGRRDVLQLPQQGGGERSGGRDGGSDLQRQRERRTDRTVGDRWRARDAASPVALRRVGNAEVGFDATRVYLCEGTPRRCREAELTADDAKRLRESLPP